MKTWQPKFWRMTTVAHSVVVIAPDWDIANEVACIWLNEHNAAGFEYSVSRIHPALEKWEVVAGYGD